MSFAQARTVEQRAREEIAPEVRRAHREAVARLGEALDAAAEAVAEVDELYAEIRRQYPPRSSRPAGDKIPTAAGAWAECTHVWRNLDPRGPLGAWHDFADKYVDRKD